MLDEAATEQMRGQFRLFGHHLINSLLLYSGHCMQLMPSLVLQACPTPEEAVTRLQWLYDAACAPPAPGEC